MELELDETIVWAISRHGHPDALRDFADKAKRLLSELRDIHEAFGHLVVVGKDCTATVPAQYEEFGAFVESHVFDKNNVIDYENLRSDGQLGPETLSKIGFSLTFFSTDCGGRIVTPEEGGIEIRLQGKSAGIDAIASIVLRLPVQRTELHAQPSLRCLLALFLDKWQCNLGGVYASRYRRIIRPVEQASYAGQWLFYLPFPHLASCLPPDIRHEPFANGLLIETTPHLPDANNPADVAAGKRVRDVLDEFGLVNDATYAIEGWPPDAEESRYEQFISGAPANRKYTVHCIKFDGYDPDRKVLLYAKLLRRLKRHPKEWGFRGWDGPVLNEAKRQVRAAAKAGGVPIEWHIGLEEPAQAVRQLLADHTNITEQQLRVIYTPLEEALSSLPP